MSESEIKSLKDIEMLFGNKDLYAQAMTHSSWVNEHPGIREHNERLEFLGDAILGFIVADHLYQTSHKQREGELTQMKHNIIDNRELAVVAHHLGIGEALFLGGSEVIGGGKTKEKILAGALEALIGALWLDQGLERVHGLVQEHILPNLPDINVPPTRHPKGLLQEYCQQSGKPIPEYHLVGEGGPDHLKTFVVEVAIEGVPYGKGEGDTKKKAETLAAEEALTKLDLE